MDTPLAIFSLLVFVVCLRIFADRFDRTRITEYITTRGGRVVKITWSPFGRGWFGEKSDRIYTVSYYDQEGSLHETTCKTSLWTGVYFSEDYVACATKPTLQDDKYQALVEENRQLRNKIAELERKLGLY